MSMGRGNIENLIPVTERTKEEAREISRNGGIQSGITRKRQSVERKLVKNIMEQAMFLPLSEKEAKFLTKAGVADGEMDLNKISLACLAVLQRCISKGDSQALIRIAELSGHHIDEKKVQIGGDVGTRKIINIFPKGSKPIEAEIVEIVKAVYIKGSAYGTDEE